jgi:hypothetical protein
MNKIKFISLAIVASVFFASNGKAQLIDLEEKQVVTQNGFEYGYIIKNEKTKKVKGDEYSRFEVTFFITNKSGCTKLYQYREKRSISDNDGNELAEFECLNANGKRFTTKKSSVDAKDFFVDAKVKVGDKEETKSIKAGYIFKNGETLKDNAILIVPLNEKPKINCNINNLQEL